MPKGSAKRAPNPLAKAIGAVQTCRAKLPALAGEHNDGDWRALLERLTGKRSLRDMTGPQLGRVLDALHAAGAPKTGPKNVRVPKGDRQARKLLALWIELGKTGALRSTTDAALCAWAAGELGLPQLDSLHFLGSAEKNLLIERLKAWCRREGVPVHG